MLCNKDKDQGVGFNLTDAESSSWQNNLPLQTTFSLRRVGDRMTDSEIQIRKGQFYHNYVRQRQKKLRINLNRTQKTKVQLSKSQCLNNLQNVVKRGWKAPQLPKATLMKL